MGIFKRKIGEIGSDVYRTICFPFVRIYIECKTKSILKQKSYLNQGTILEGKNYIGKRTYLSHVHLGFGSYINNDCVMKNTEIGKYTSIGTEVSCAFGQHPVSDIVAMHPAFYASNRELGYTYTQKDGYKQHLYLDQEKHIQLKIGNDVWIGNRVTFLENIEIGDGAVIGTGAVVTKNVEPYGIYAGVPARKIGSRFDKEEIEKLLKIKWWNKGEVEMKKDIDSFQHIHEFLKKW